MEHLPDLVLNKICEFLSVKDLGACCASSTSWRDVFNQDHVWWPLCDQLMAVHLKVTECQVEPGFVSPETKDSPLSPICEWRMSYMREVHLWNNWRRHRFTVKYFGSIHADGRYPFVQFVNNNLVIMKLQNDRKVMLWDVTETPVLLSCPATLITHKNVDLCEILDNKKIIFLQFDIIQIFTMAPQTSDPWTPIGVYHLSPLGENVRTAFVADRKVIAVRRDDYVEVFDLESCKTLVMSYLPEPTSDYTFVKDVITSGKLSKHFAVILQRRKSDRDLIGGLQEGITVFVYSIQKLRFLQFKIYIPGREYYKTGFYCAFLENYLAMFYAGFLTIYNYLTSELIYRTSKVYHANTVDYIPVGFNSLTANRISKASNHEGPHIDKKTPTLFLENKCNNDVPVFCQCLKLKEKNLTKLMQGKLKDNDPQPVNTDIIIPIKDPKIVVNEVHTKAINLMSPEVVYYW